jgi:hypothetical protein
MPTVSLPSSNRGFPLGRRARDASSALATALVRRSVDALGAGQHSCRHCHRTPLVGELLHAYGPDLVCELCLPLRTGMPDRSLRVHHPEHERAVRALGGARP